jgi:hypothetical protein
LEGNGRGLTEIMRAGVPAYIQAEQLLTEVKRVSSTTTCSVCHGLIGIKNNIKFDFNSKDVV